jgi:hypothetical protein
MGLREAIVDDEFPKDLTDPLTNPLREISSKELASPYHAKYTRTTVN